MGMMPVAPVAVSTLRPVDVDQDEARRHGIVARAGEGSWRLGLPRNVMPVLGELTALLVLGVPVMVTLLAGMAWAAAMMMGAAPVGAGAVLGVLVMTGMASIAGVKALRRGLHLLASTGRVTLVLGAEDWELAGAHTAAVDRVVEPRTVLPRRAASEATRAFHNGRHHVQLANGTVLGTFQRQADADYLVRLLRAYGGGERRR